MQPVRDPMAYVRAERAGAAADVDRSLKAWRKVSGGGAGAAAPPPTEKVPGAWKAQLGPQPSPWKIPTEGGAPLAGGVRSKMEGQLGADLSGVKVHTGGESAQAASGLNARAMTVGSDVHFNQGQFAPGTKEGDRLLAHELTHVVQGQKSGIQRKAEDAGGEAKGAAGMPVSEPGEAAEVEADKVGDHVADNLHGGADGGKAGVDGGKAGGAPGKEKAPAIGAKLEGAGRKVFRTKDDKKTETPKAKDEPKVNPDYEKDAIAFENVLGGKAMAHPMANAAAKTLTDKARVMVEMIAKKGLEGADKQKEREAKFNQLLGDMTGNAPGLKSEGIAGAVGNTRQVLDEVFAAGNLRERLTIIFNFMRPFSNALIQADIAEREAFIKEMSLNGDMIRTRLEGMKKDPKMNLVGDPNQKASKMQGESRVDGGDKSSKRKPSQLPKGAELSKREIAFQGLETKPDGSINEAVQQTLKWKEGADKWQAKESADYVKKLKGLQQPFGAGPSGTTDRIMSMAQLLGYSDPIGARLACMGYLLPIRAHSLHEILTAATVYGCDFTDGKEMYRNLKPFSEAELRTCGNGKFPDEPKDDGQAVVPPQNNSGPKKT